MGIAEGLFFLNQVSSSTPGEEEDRKDLFFVDVPLKNTNKKTVELTLMNGRSCEIFIQKPIFPLPGFFVFHVCE